MTLDDSPLAKAGCIVTSEVMTRFIITHHDRHLDIIPVYEVFLMVERTPVRE